MTNRCARRSSDLRAHRLSVSAKSRALTNVIDLIIYIEQFKQQCVIFKGLLHSERLKEYVVAIGIDQ